MKKMALSSLFAAGLLVACGSSSSSSDDAASSSSQETPSSSSSLADCTLKEEGVKILLPESNSEWKIGDSITVQFVANYVNAGGFRVIYKVDENDKGTDLFSGSVGEEAPDGTSCTTVSAFLDADVVQPSDNAVLRVQSYNAPKIRNDVQIVVKE